MKPEEAIKRLQVIHDKLCEAANILCEGNADKDCDAVEMAISALEKQEKERWIPCSERMPEMHDAGILKKLGISQRSHKCMITIEKDGEKVVDNDAELRDGKWHSDFIRFLDAGKKEYKVTAWRPFPEPYTAEGEE